MSFYGKTPEAEVGLPTREFLVTRTDTGARVTVLAEWVEFGQTHISFHSDGGPDRPARLHWAIQANLVREITEKTA